LATRRGEGLWSVLPGPYGYGFIVRLFALFEAEQMNFVVPCDLFARRVKYQARIINAVWLFIIERQRATHQPDTVLFGLARQKRLYGPVARRLFNRQLVRILVSHKTKI